MNNLSTRLKIGALTLISALLCVVMVLSISNLSFKPKREIRVDFSFINSLEARSPVRFAGARVGEVKRIHILTRDERETYENPPYVSVYAAVDKEVAIPKGSKGMVNTMGFMGEKYLEILPESKSTDYIADDATLEGVDPTPMDSVFASAKKLSDEMQIAARNMNALTVGMQDRLPVLIGELEKTLTSAQELAGDAKHLTGDVQIMVNANRENVQHLLANGRQITIYMKSLSHVLAKRPWKIIWGLGGPLPIEAEDAKVELPPEKKSKAE